MTDCTTQSFDDVEIVAKRLESSGKREKSFFFYLFNIHQIRRMDKYIGMNE